MGVLLVPVSEIMNTGYAEGDGGKLLTPSESHLVVDLLHTLTC
eukprot:COSAG06_NODE_44213_length_365_cov_0.966165_2_plen_42_part_01